jgi:hypothetical protein
MFLTDDELRRMTGTPQKGRQAEWLRANGVEFRLSLGGRPIVTRSAIGVRDPAPPPDPEVEALRAWKRGNPQWRPPSIDDLRAQSAAYAFDELPDECGLYFLFSGDCLLYIGMSVDIAARIIAHRRARRIPFDRFAWLALPSLLLRRVEWDLIRRERPPFNIMGNFPCEP